MVVCAGFQHQWSSVPFPSFPPIYFRKNDVLVGFPIRTFIGACLTGELRKEVITKSWRVLWDGWTSQPAPTK